MSSRDMTQSLSHLNKHHITNTFLKNCFGLEWVKLQVILQ